MGRGSLAGAGRTCNRPRDMGNEFSSRTEPKEHGTWKVVIFASSQSLKTTRPITSALIAVSNMSEAKGSAGASYHFFGQFCGARAFILCQEGKGQSRSTKTAICQVSSPRIEKALAGQKWDATT